MYTANPEILYVEVLELHFQYESQLKNIDCSNSLPQVGQVSCLCYLNPLAKHHVQRLFTLFCKKKIHNFFSLYYLFNQTIWLLTQYE